MAESIQISVRIDIRMAERADALIDLVAEKTGIAAVRADVWREALVRGLAALEKERREKR